MDDRPLAFFSPKHVDHLQLRLPQCLLPFQERLTSLDARGELMIAAAAGYKELERPVVRTFLIAPTDSSSCVGTLLGLTGSYREAFRSETRAI